MIISISLSPDKQFLYVINQEGNRNPTVKVFPLTGGKCAKLTITPKDGVANVDSVNPPNGLPSIIDLEIEPGDSLNLEYNESGGGLIIIADMHGMGNQPEGMNNIVTNYPGQVILLDLFRPRGGRIPKQEEVIICVEIKEGNKCVLKVFQIL